MKKGNFSLFLLLWILLLAGCGKQSLQAPEEMIQQTNDNNGKENPAVSKEEASTSAQDPAAEHSATIFAMDTVMNVKIHGGNDSLLKQIETQVLELENLFSTTKAGSDIYTLNRQGTASVAQDTEALLGKALDLCVKTHGDLDISIYPIVKA